MKMRLTALLFFWYYFSIKTNTKSSITLPSAELKLVDGLMKALGIKTKVDVIRRGLRLLKESTDRKSLRIAYRKASIQSRSMSSSEEIKELDCLSAEGLD